MSAASTLRPGFVDSQHLEDLRLAPSEDAWRLEIENVLDGFRDIVIEHRGDAGGYVDDLIEEAQNPSLSRIAFLNALERQVEQWKPPRGAVRLLELLHRFTPRAGFHRLVEMFRSESAFPGDPPPEASEFLGCDLRLAALHALERYFPTPPLTEDKERQENFEIYASILRSHLWLNRYRSYASEMLRELGAKIFRLTPDSVGKIETSGPCLFWIGRSSDSFAIDSSAGFSGDEDQPYFPANPLPNFFGLALEPRALEAAYEAHLTYSQSSEQSFRASMDSLGWQIRYELEGPLLRSANPSHNLPELGIRVSPNLYHLYFPLFIQNNDMSALRNIEPLSSLELPR